MAPPTRNVHTLSQREFIVRRLAAFEPPRAIVAAFCAVYSDTACNENDVLATDPETTLVAPELFALYRTERERVMLDPSSAPFADQRARLIALSNQAKFYSGNNQFPEMRTVLRQIAEEQGVVGGAGKASKALAGAAEKPVTVIQRTIVDPAAGATPTSANSDNC